MALRDTLNRLASAPRLIREHNAQLALSGPASPWAPWPSHLAQVDVPEWAEQYSGYISRHQALKVPAVARARGLICGTIARLPMKVCNAPGTPVSPQPTWLDRSDGSLPAWKRTALAVEDMLFDGWALLSVERGKDGWPTRLGYIPFSRWEFDPDGRVRIDRGIERDGDYRDWEYAQPGTVCVIPGPHEGVLHFGADAIKAAADLARTAARSARNPIPAMELHDEGERPLSDLQVAKLVASWERVLAKNTGVAYTNKSIKLITHGQQNADLVVEGRNAAAVDVARLMGVPASLIDASPTDGGSSRAYENVAGRNAEFVDYGLSPFMSALVARLGMDDLCPRGQHIEIDLDGFTSLRPANAATPDDGADPKPLPVDTGKEPTDD